MSIYPNHNVIDSVYKHCNNIKSNIVLNIQNSIFRTVLSGVKDYNFITIENQQDTSNIYDLFNIDLYILADYIQHSQHRDTYKQYHIKEMVLLTEPPMSLLKREDLILLSERLDGVYKITVGPDKIHSSWSFIQNTKNILPGIPSHKLNKENRKDVCILHNNTASAKRLCNILSQKYPDLKAISQFENYNLVMETLNSYKVCINLNTSIDSLYALYAGCSVISALQLYEHEQVYENIEHIIQLISQELSDFDISEKTNIHNNLAKHYSNEIFTDNISNLISKYTKEPFYI